MSERVPYWKVSFGEELDNAVRTKLYKLRPKSQSEVAINDELLKHCDGIPEDIFRSFYLPGSQISLQKKTGTVYNIDALRCSTRISSRLEGLRTQTLENIIVHGETQDFGVNIKGAGSIFDVNFNGGDFYFSHPHAKGIKPESVPIGVNFRANVLAITNMDFDLGLDNERPAGGQNLNLGLNALLNSMSDISKYLCPVVSVVRVPKEYILKISPHCIETFSFSETWSSHPQILKDTFDRYAQEIRLLPSNVRINHTLRQRHYNINFEAGLTDDRTLSSLKEKKVDPQGFLENAISSAIDLAFIPYRYAQHNADGTVDMYTYHDVDLRKDAAVCLDGKLLFADLEGIKRARVDKDKFKETVKSNIKSLRLPYTIYGIFAAANAMRHNYDANGICYTGRDGVLYTSPDALKEVTNQRSLIENHLPEGVSLEIVDCKDLEKTLVFNLQEK